jgi:hypothetical protein
VKFDRQFRRSTLEDRIDIFIREFADRFFRVISWTIYLSAMLTIYFKTGNAAIWWLCFFGYVVMFLFINSYMRHLTQLIVDYFKIDDRPLFFLPLIAISGVITFGLVSLSNVAALEIAKYGK